MSKQKNRSSKKIREWKLRSKNAGPNMRNEKCRKLE